MPDLRSPRARVLLVVGAVLVVLLTAVRGPVVVLAVSSLLLAAGLGLGLLPLLRRDDLAWDWLPGARDEVATEPELARLERLVRSASGNADAAFALQDLVRAIALDRSRGRPPADGPLATYLDSVPAHLDLAEVEELIDRLEHLRPPKEIS